MWTSLSLLLRRASSQPSARPSGKHCARWRTPVKDDRHMKRPMLIVRRKKQASTRGA
jgi:hypothetical protein